MRRGTAALACLLLLPLSGCGAVDDPATLRVLAASSLTDVFTDLAQEFEADHDGVDVELSFGSSTDLAQQAADGAPGDVLATADGAAMVAAENAGAVDDPQVFGTNVLVIVTPPGNPGRIRSLADLAGTTWVRCADEVPCGRVASTVLAAADVDAEPVSLEEDVRATLDKVVSGEADAGLVYASDAVAAGAAVATIRIPGAGAERTSYFIDDLAQAGDKDLAAAWVHLVLGAKGQQALRDAGFGTP